VVADLLWDDFRWFFDPEMMGRLPDVTVPGAAFHYSEGEEELPLPQAAAVLSRPADAECPELRVWPTADVLAIFRFYAAEEIDFDVDLRELQGQERLDVLCGFLAAIGRRLWHLGPALSEHYQQGDKNPLHVAAWAKGCPVTGWRLGSLVRAWVG
jgi:hypothetical protein